MKTYDHRENGITNVTGGTGDENLDSGHVCGVSCD